MHSTHINKQPRQEVSICCRSINQDGGRSLDLNDDCRADTVIQPYASRGAHMGGPATLRSSQKTHSQFKSETTILRSRQGYAIYA